MTAALAAHHEETRSLDATGTQPPLAGSLPCAGRRALPSLGSRGPRALLAHESATPNTAAGLPPRPRIARLPAAVQRCASVNGCRAGLVGLPMVARGCSRLSENLTPG